MITITDPGVYDLPAADYFADPVPGGSLSSTGARRLLEVPPARWLYEKSHPTPPTPAMVLGTAVHSLTLGTGPKVVEIDADDWRTNKAKAERDEALAVGNVPLLRDDYGQAFQMATAVLSHPLASHLFTYERGKPEQALVWRDEEFGIWRRSMVDHLPHPGGDVRPILVDLKTTDDASPRGVIKSVTRYGYDRQAPFYQDGYRALFPGSDPAFLFVFVEKPPPHLVRVVELDQLSLLAGADANRRALEIYRDCVESGIWPGYDQEIHLISLPPWAVNRHWETAS